MKHRVCDSLRFIANQLPDDRICTRGQLFWSTHRPKRTWWTGEDSNLRSPQGAADLQSAGFSHSPTRPRKKSQRNANRITRKNKSTDLAPQAKTQNRLVSRATSPSILTSMIRSPSLPSKIPGRPGVVHISPNPLDTQQMPYH